MSKAAISEAIQRRLDRPDIHQPISRDSKSYGDSVSTMIVDLKEHVPNISNRQLSTLLGVGKTFVAIVLDAKTASTEEWTTDNNESQSAAELAALRKHHSGYTNQTDFASPSLVDGASPDLDEPATGIPLFLTAPEFRDTYRRADQSHTVKRPITLATTPFNVAA